MSEYGHRGLEGGGGVGGGDSRLVDCGDVLLLRRNEELSTSQ